MMTEDILDEMIRKQEEKLEYYKTVKSKSEKSLQLFPVIHSQIMNTVISRANWFMLFFGQERLARKTVSLAFDITLAVIDQQKYLEAMCDDAKNQLEGMGK